MQLLNNKYTISIMFHYTLYYVNKTGYQAHCNSLLFLFSQCKCNAIDVSEGERG